MLKYFLSLSLVALMFQSCNACDPDQQLGESENESDDYFDVVRELVPDALHYSKPLYYQTVPAYGNFYHQPEARNLLSGQQAIITPFSKYVISKKQLGKIYLQFANDEQKNEAETRFLFGSWLNAAILNDRFRPANMFRLPLSRFAIRSPLLDTCTTPNGYAGICASSSVCSTFGGRPSGSCTLGKMCCINEIDTCGGTVTLNNTFWQSPPTEITGPTICALNIKLGSKFLEKIAKPICQIRLDFLSFTIAQPTAGTCADAFQVSGASTTPPVICGDNSGQHMYLDVPPSDPSSTDVQLMFNFARISTLISRLWKIKIALLPCGAPYLAPVDCLQYFTSPTGRVSSFNWQDVPVNAIRQLNNQNYNACFRTELVNRQATDICFSVCPTTNTGAGFSITTNANSVGNSLLGLGNNVQGYCTYDFLGIRSATDSITGLGGDRFCGEHLNTARAPGGASTSIQLCTRMKPFKVTYVTDGTESEVGAPALVFTPGDINNVGFCIDYQQRAN